MRNGNWLVVLALTLIMSVPALAEEQREAASFLPGVATEESLTAWEFTAWEEAGFPLFSISGEDESNQLFTNGLLIVGVPTEGDDAFFGFMPTAIRSSVMTMGDLERITTQTVFDLGDSDSYAAQLKRCEWMSTDAMAGLIYFLPIPFEIDGLKYKPISFDASIGDENAYTASFTGWVPLPTSHPLNYTFVFDITKSKDNYIDDLGGFAEIRHRLTPDGSSHVSVGYANHLSTDMFYVAFGTLLQ